MRHIDTPQDFRYQYVFYTLDTLNRLHYIVCIFTYKNTMQNYFNSISWENDIKKRINYKLHNHNYQNYNCKQKKEKIKNGKTKRKMM